MVAPVDSRKPLVCCVRIGLRAVQYRSHHFNIMSALRLRAGKLGYLEYFVFNATQREGKDTGTSIHIRVRRR